jgi:bacteriorhodopsin
LTTFAVVIATLSYFAMATGSGTYYAYHLAREHHKHGIPDTFEPVLRQVFWVRYVDWALTTPLLLLDLAFLAGVNGANIFVAVFANIVTMLTGLFFAYSENTSQRWGWYAMACVAHLVVIYQLIVVGRRAVLGEDRKAATLYVSLGAPSLVIWTLYPVVWGKS